MLQLHRAVQGITFNESKNREFVYSFMLKFVNISITIKIICVSVCPSFSKETTATIHTVFGRNICLTFCNPKQGLHFFYQNFYAILSDFPTLVKRICFQYFSPIQLMLFVLLSIKFSRNSYRNVFTFCTFFMRFQRFVFPSAAHGG